MIPTEYVLALSALLLVVGLYGVLVRRNALIVLMSVEIVLSAAILNFVAFSAYLGDPAGQTFALLVIALAAAEAAVGLGILLVVYEAHGSVLLDRIRLLRW